MATVEMEETLESDHMLIRACRNGNIGAWESVLAKYERLVFSIPLNYGLSREDAADIAQITFTSLIQRLDTLHEDSHLGSWLATVARRATWRVIERSRRDGVHSYEDLTETMELSETLGAGSVERWELIEWLNQGLSRLNERCRELLLALYFDQEQPSYTDVAAQFDIPVGSVGPTRARCLERLKQLLRNI